MTLRLQFSLFCSKLSTYIHTYISFILTRSGLKLKALEHILYFNTIGLKAKSFRTLCDFDLNEAIDIYGFSQINVLLSS